MKKLSLLLLVAVVMAGAVYAVQAYAGNKSDAAVATNSTTGDQSAAQAGQCPGHADCTGTCDHSSAKHADCPGTCDHGSAKCADCPNFVDANGDGKCDRHGACCSAEAQKSCAGHAEGGCARHQ